MTAINTWAFLFTTATALALTVAVLLACMALAWMIGTLWNIDEMYRWLLENSK